MSNVSHLNDLRDATAIVVGGSTGIGRGIADVLAQEGARVVVLSRTPPLNASGEADSSLVWRRVDLANPDESRTRLREIMNEFGEYLDAVFYSAIYYGPKRTPFLDVAEDEWLRQLNVNLHGLWLTLSLCLPALRKRAPGLFVHLSSEVVYNAGPGRSGYAATKAAGSNLVRSLAQEDPDGSVRLVQLLPAKMVDTAGIRSRRPRDFDFSEYMTPQHFQETTLQIMRTRGEGLHGESMVVDDSGQLWRADDIIPASQSNHRCE
jgi:NAD(P)-dependent dehydrogenase (short-subunit alcohol dehydrogenase family)